MRILQAALIIVLSLGTGNGYALQDADSVYAEVVYPGVIHRIFYFNDGPVVLHLLETDRTDRNIELISALAGGRLTGRKRVSEIRQDIEQKHNAAVIAGINGDFFSGDGCPVSLHVESGRIATAPSQRSVFFEDYAGNLHIDRLELNANITDIDGDFFHIVDINRYSPDQNGFTLFNRFYGTRTDSDTACIELQLRSFEYGVQLNEPNYGVIGRVDTGPDGIAIPAKGAVLKGPASLGNTLTSGETVDVLLATPPHLTAIEDAVGGAVRLIRNGKISIENEEEGVRESFVHEKHPRTAVGFTRDGATLFFLVVDGRQPDYSIGMNLIELAEFMLARNAHQALNLDGGGSTTMIIGDTIVNRPSDLTGERPVANGLFLTVKK